MSHDNDTPDEAENEMAEIQEQMKNLAMRGLVLSARRQVQETQEHIEAPLDLRTWVAASIFVGALASGAPDDAPVGMITGTVFKDVEPVIARLELEAAAESGFLADLPIYEGPGGDTVD